MTNQELISMQASKLAILYLEKNSFKELDIDNPIDLSDKYMKIYFEIYNNLVASYNPHYEI